MFQLTHCLHRSTKGHLKTGKANCRLFGRIIFPALLAIYGLLAVAGALSAAGAAAMGAEESVRKVARSVQGMENRFFGGSVRLDGFHEDYGLGDGTGTGGTHRTPGGKGAAGTGGAFHVVDSRSPSSASTFQGHLLSKKISVAAAVPAFVLLQVFFFLVVSRRYRGNNNRPGGTGSSGEASVELRGDLEMLSVPDLLQLISSCRKTGTLMVYNSHEQKSLSFRNGKIISAACLDRDRKNKLGYLLVKRGLISEGERTRALRICEKDRSMRLGQALTANGVLTNDDLAEVLKVQAEEIVYSMIAYPEGRFEFAGYDEGAQMESENGFVLDVMSLVMEGVRREDEWNRMREIIPSLEMVVDFIPDQDRAVDTARMNQHEKEIVDQIDGHRTLSEICAQSHLVDFEVCTLVYGLFCQGVLARVEAV